MPPLGARSRKNYQNQLEIESFEEDHNVAGHVLTDYSLEQMENRNWKGHDPFKYFDLT